MSAVQEMAQEAMQCTKSVANSAVKEAFGHMREAAEKSYSLLCQAQKDASSLQEQRNKLYSVIVDV